MSARPTRGRSSQFGEIDRLRKALPATPYAFCTPEEKALYAQYRTALRALRASNKKPPPAEPEEAIGQTGSELTRSGQREPESGEGRPIS